MNLAVKFYSQEENLHNIPSNWPSVVIQLGDSTDLPSAEYTLMTLEEYNHYREDNTYLYTAWQDSQGI